MYVYAVNAQTIQQCTMLDGMSTSSGGDGSKSHAENGEQCLQVFSADVLYERPLNRQGEEHTGGQ